MQYRWPFACRSEEHTSELQSRQYLVCRLLLEKKNKRGRRMSDNSQRDTSLSLGLATNVEGTESLEREVLEGMEGQGRSAPDFELFFFNDTATTEIYTLSLHDALPI